MELLIIQYSLAIPLGLIFISLPFKIILIIKDSSEGIINNILK